MRRFSRRTTLPLLPSVQPLAIVGRATTALRPMSAVAAPRGRRASWPGRVFSVWMSRPPERDMMDSCEVTRWMRVRGLLAKESSKLGLSGILAKASLDSIEIAVDSSDDAAVVVRSGISSPAVARMVVRSSVDLGSLLLTPVLILGRPPRNRGLGAENCLIEALDGCFL